MKSKHKPNKKKSGVVVLHTCEVSTWEVGEGRSGVQGQHGLRDTLKKEIVKCLQSLVITKKTVGFGFFLL